MNFTRNIYKSSYFFHIYIIFHLKIGDGIYDKLCTKESIESIWHEAHEKPHLYKNVHEFCGLAVDTILKFSLGRKTMDNITVVMIGFDNIKRHLFHKHEGTEYSSKKETNNLETT